MQRQVQGAALAVGGLGLAGVQYVQATARTSTTTGLLIETVPFVLMALVIAYAGYWIVERPGETNEDIIGVWALGGGVGFAALSALMITSINVSLPSSNVGTAVPAFVVDNITVGTLAGLLIGVYDAQNRTQLEELAAQRDRIEGFANRAADLNNYGQALNQCQSVPEVSAFCIEAVATLVDIDETAFLEQQDGEMGIVDNAVTSVPEETVIQLAQRGADGELATVQSHTERLPAAFDEEPQSVLTMLVTDTDTRSVVIVAVNRRGNELTDETRSLLEMLIAHAGTALSSLPDPETQVDIEL